MSTIGDAANRSKRSSSPRAPVYLRIGANGFIAGRSSAPYNLSYATKFAKVLAVVRYQQRLGGSPLGEDHFMGLQLDMEVVDDVTIDPSWSVQSTCHSPAFQQELRSHRPKGCGSAKGTSHDEDTDRQSKASDTNRRDAPMPGVAILSEPLTSNPFDWQCPAEVSTRAPILKSSTGISPLGRRIRVPRTKQCGGPDPPPPGPLGPLPQPPQPSAFARLEIDASTGRLTAPVAAILPARLAELLGNVCGRETDTEHLNLSN